MICEECKRAGLESNVYEGVCSSTLMGIDRYYDKEKKYHIHNANVIIQSYKCSNGHYFDVKRKDFCWCGWGKEDYGLA